jgi:hypothetical protein
LGRAASLVQGCTLYRVVGRAQIRTKHAPTTPYATRKPRIDTRTPPNSPWGPGRRGSTGHRILQEEIRSRGLQNAEIAFLGGWYKFEAP